ncbi:hypothetical protein MtrunA17_Chr5g0425761 [Medicago truncatula]|uniref:VQ motif protein n=1 Tax=Medicago truncatula TaxID=3880 RepID=G7KAC6_MEDTR|nr:putative uncharacterized protein DDB_G0277255 [Medicago truncatula]AES98028.1 VQ motif protein [Medicago truncatula]RHN56103.1 hypothetical protein MtrunA17_Chr5g0425761 [Medicago truncatula]
MDSGNSGSISSSGDEEYDSRNHQTLLPSNFFNQQPTLQFGSISHNPQSSLQSFNATSTPISLFDLSPNYLQNLSHSQQNTNPFPNLHPQNSQHGVSSSSLSSQQHINQCLLTTPHQGQAQAFGVHDDNNNARASLSSSLPATTTTTTNNAARNSKKRTRASRRAPTTVLTTDTSNFRAMVQEFTGIPAPPFSGSSYSRRLDLLTSSSSLRSNNSSHFDTSSSFYPLRPSPQKLHHHNHPNPLLLSSSSSHNMVDANVNNNYELPSDLGLPYTHHHQHNFMISMQNQQPIHTFNNPSSSQQFHPFSNIGGLGAKSQQQQGSLSVNSLEDLGVNQGQGVNPHLGVNHGHDDDYGCGKVIGSSSSGGGGGGGVGSNCKINFSGSASTTLNHDKTMENNNDNSSNNNNRGEGGGVDSWICSSD